jgi:hypothetical protein
LRPVSCGGLLPFLAFAGRGAKKGSVEAAIPVAAAPLMKLRRDDAKRAWNFSRQSLHIFCFPGGGSSCDDENAVSLRLKRRA